MPPAASSTAAPVVIVGPTASGKSAVAMAAAERTPGVEIVAVDAMQVYRGMDIGTAKPTAADRAAVPHHGVDLVDPDAEMTVTEYRRIADAALDRIAAAGGRALLVAGTGLYLTALIDRLELPGTFPEQRAALDAVDDTAALYERLVELDPLAAERIEPANRRRIVRALEVTLGAGRPFSSFGPGVTAHPPTPVVQIGLRWPRSVLAGRIAERVRQMVEDGLVDEVERIWRAGMSRTAAQALGYKELIDVFLGRATLDEALDAVVTRTRQYAVRQERWFRRDPRIRWIDVDAAARDPLGPAVAAVCDALNA